MTTEKAVPIIRRLWLLVSCIWALGVLAEGLLAFLREPDFDQGGFNVIQHDGFYLATHALHVSGILLNAAAPFILGFLLIAAYRFVVTGSFRERHV